MIKPRSTQSTGLHAAAIDSALTDLTNSRVESEALLAEATREDSTSSSPVPTPGSSAPAPSPSVGAAKAPDEDVAKKPPVKTSVPPQVWVTSLASRKRYHDLASIFRSDSYHARTDTAEEKRRLATVVFLKAGPDAVDALIDMLVERDVANVDIAELLIEINDPKAAPYLRQCYETGKFARPPRDIRSFIARHLGP